MDFLPGMGSLAGRWMVTHRATCPPIAPPAGVRMISLSYSRISLADIAQKLQLDSPEDAEFIVAKVGCALPASYTGGRSGREFARGYGNNQSHQEMPVTVAKPGGCQEENESGLEC